MFLPNWHSKQRKNFTHTKKKKTTTTTSFSLTQSKEKNGVCVCIYICNNLWKWIENTLNYQAAGGNWRFHCQGPRTSVVRGSISWLLFFFVLERYIDFTAEVHVTSFQLFYLKLTLSWEPLLSKKKDTHHIY